MSPLRVLVIAVFGVSPHNDFVGTIVTRHSEFPNFSGHVVAYLFFERVESHSLRNHIFAFVASDMERSFIPNFLA